MKIAVLIRGIHYDPGYKLGIDYRKTIENFRDYLINDLKIKENSVNIFLSTYNSKYYTQITQDYSAKGCVQNEFDEYSRHGTIVKGLDLILNENVDYDLVIIYRFDIKLKIKFTEIQNINYDKLNIPFFAPGMHKNEKRINDAFYVFPYKNIQIIRDIFDFAIGQRQSHNHFYRHFKDKLGKQNVNIILNKTFDSHSDKQKNPIYQNRIK